MGQQYPKLSKDDLNRLCTISSLTKDQILEWQAVYYEHYPDGLLSKDQFVDENRNAFGGPSEFWSYLFTQIDTNDDGLVTFIEFVELFASATTATANSKLKWAFMFFDRDKSGFIEYDEMLAAYNEIFNFAKDAIGASALEPQTAARRCQSTFEKMDTDADGRLSIEEFIIGCRGDTTILGALEPHLW